MADLSRRAATFPSTYSSPQFVQTRAGTPLKTDVVPSLSRVTVALPIFVSPFLHQRTSCCLSPFEIRFPFRQIRLVYGDPSAAQPQPKLGISPAKALSSQRSDVVISNEERNLSQIPRMRSGCQPSLSLGDFLGGRNFRLRVLSPSRSPAQATQFLNFSSASRILIAFGNLTAQPIRTH